MLIYDHQPIWIITEYIWDETPVTRVLKSLLSYANNIVLMAESEKKLTEKV